MVPNEGIYIWMKIYHDSRSVVFTIVPQGTRMMFNLLKMKEKSTRYLEWF